MSLNAFLGCLAAFCVWTCKLDGCVTFLQLDSHGAKNDISAAWSRGEKRHFCSTGVFFCCVTFLQLDSHGAKNIHVRWCFFVACHFCSLAAAEQKKSTRPGVFFAVWMQLGSRGAKTNAPLFFCCVADLRATCKLRAAKKMNNRRAASQPKTRSQKSTYRCVCMYVCIYVSMYV